MHFVKFHPEVASCLLSRGKRKYAPLGMRLKPLIETLYRENVSFRDRDLKRLTRCHMASENFDAELLLNIQVST